MATRSYGLLLTVLLVILGVVGMVCAFLYAYVTPIALLADAGSPAFRIPFWTGVAMGPFGLLVFCMQFGRFKPRYALSILGGVCCFSLLGITGMVHFADPALWLNTSLALCFAGGMFLLFEGDTVWK